MKEFNGVDFVFISDQEPASLIMRFIEDHNLKFDQDFFEYPWSVEDDSPAIEFSSFDKVLEHVLSQPEPEYAFYPTGGLNCWFGVAKDRSVVFGVQYYGETPEKLGCFAARYGGKFGFVAIIDAPDLDGIKSFKAPYVPDTFESDNFILFDEDWVRDNCNKSKVPDESKGFIKRLFGK